MVAPIKQLVTVKQQGVLEVRSPQLQPGMQAEVTVVVQGAMGSRSLRSFSGAARGIFKDPAEVDEFVRRERDAWDH
jgi:hypothetical protein